MSNFRSFWCLILAKTFSHIQIWSNQSLLSKTVEKRILSGQFSSGHVDDSFFLFNFDRVRPQFCILTGAIYFKFFSTGSISIGFDKVTYLEHFNVLFLLRLLCVDFDCLQLLKSERTSWTWTMNYVMYCTIISSTFLNTLNTHKWPEIKQSKFSFTYLKVWAIQLSNLPSDKNVLKRIFYLTASRFEFISDVSVAYQ